MSVFSGGVRGKEREQQSPLLGPHVDQFLVVNQRSFRKKKKENQSSFITNHAFLAARFHGLKPTLANIVTRANALRSPRFELNDCETKKRKEKGKGQGLFRERPRNQITRSTTRKKEKKKDHSHSGFTCSRHVLCFVRFLYKMRYPHSRQMTISPGRSTTSEPQSAMVEDRRVGWLVSGNSRKRNPQGGTDPRRERGRGAPPQLYVTPAALAFWLYTSPPYMTLHTPTMAAV